MKVKTLIALIAFAMTICAPFHIDIHHDSDSKSASFLTLDVCHASGPSMSVQADMPFINARPCMPFVHESNWAYAASEYCLSQLLIGLKSERPPKV